MAAMQKLQLVILAALLAGCAGGAPPSPATTASVAGAVTLVQTVTAEIAAACSEIAPFLPLAGAIPIIGVYVVPGVQLACNTDAGLQKLAGDPSSATWLGEQLQILKTALHRK